MSSPDQDPPVLPPVRFYSFADSDPEDASIIFWIKSDSVLKKKKMISRYSGPFIGIDGKFTSLSVTGFLVI